VAFTERQSPCPEIPALIFADGRLTGVKPAVCGGAHADVAVVLANRDGTPVLAVASLDGVERDIFNTFDNSRCTAHLSFSAAPAVLLMSGQKALDAALHILALQSVVVAFEQTGGAEAMMLRARDYANSRRAFGQLIGGFQSVKHRIAELYTVVEIARANALRAASLEGHADFLKASAVARLSATEAYDTATRDCTQIHGGIGVTWEAGLHLHQRRTRSLAIEQGNGIFWEDVLVNQLLKEAA
jgi:alkylation response protein AidB-like acyl-CoA dehydrogenase